MDIKIGADPEVFVVNSEGKFRSAHGLIPGTKAEPFRVDRGAVQVDGMALEFNIDPAGSEDEFATNIFAVLRQLEDMIRPKGYSIVIQPTAVFNGNHFRAQPDEAKELGCEPDFSAYTLAENPKPDNKRPMRTAAGHVHIGFTEGADTADETHRLRCAALVKHLDVYLGIPSLLWDADTKRRAMYGCAGAFRPKPYGMEYRTLSNQWLKSEELTRYVYRQTRAAVDALIGGERFDEGGAFAFKYERARRLVDHSEVFYAEHFLQGTLKHLAKPPVNV